MKGFYLANSSSINLNFLIYIHNLYENYIEANEMPNKFPWLSLEKDGLLNINEFRTRVKDLWTIVFDSISISNDLNKIDFEYWKSNKFPFNDLLNSNPLGLRSYSEIKKTFESWYWGNWNRMGDIFSDGLVVEYYNQLKNIAEINSLSLRNTWFYLQVVYDKPPFNWEIKNEKMIIISPNSQLPTSQEIFKICSE